MWLGTGLRESVEPDCFKVFNDNFRLYSREGSCHGISSHREALLRAFVNLGEG
jgi:hypothetical protein